MTLSSGILKTPSKIPHTNSPTQVQDHLFQFDDPVPFQHLSSSTLQVLLSDGEVSLKVEELCPSQPQKQWVPSYEFKISSQDGKVDYGRLNLRCGHLPALFWGGHIGYGIDEIHRGKRYATKASKLAITFARKYHSIDTIYITCDPTNLASRKTIEALEGGIFEGVFRIPEGHIMYQQGDREVCVWKFSLNSAVCSVYADCYSSIVCP